MSGMGRYRSTRITVWSRPATILVAVLLLASCGRSEPRSKSGNPAPARPRPAESAAAPIVFAAIADVQYCDCEPKGTRFYRESVWKLREAMQWIARVETDFIISVGDIIDRDFASYATILPEYFAGSDGDRYSVLGNHDWKVEQEDQELVLGTLGLESRYDCFGVDGWRFLIMDGTEVSTYATVDGTEQRAAAAARLEQLEDSGTMNARSYNGAVSAVQLLWLENELGRAQDVGERVIIFNHFPLHPPEARHNLWNDGDVRWVLERSPGVVVAHISGHDHRGGYAQVGGVHYLTLNGMVETEDQNAFAIFYLYSDRIEVEGFGRQPSDAWMLR
jgi:manganese-dependent ADP-ribose/CDP-alcohol diphosphatase